MKKMKYSIIAFDSLVVLYLGHAQHGVPVFVVLFFSLKKTSDNTTRFYLAILRYQYKNFRDWNLLTCLVLEKVLGNKYYFSLGLMHCIFFMKNYKKCICMCNMYKFTKINKTSKLMCSNQYMSMFFCFLFKFI